MSFATVRLMPMLPWDVTPQERNRFRNLVVGILLFIAIAGGIMPFLPTFEQEKKKRVEPPERIVKLVLEQKKKKLPPPPPPKPKEKKKPELKEKPKPKEKPKEKPKPKERPKPKPKEVPKQSNKQQARQKAEQAGADFDIFDDIRDNDAVAKIRNTGNATNAGGQSAKVERDVIVSKTSRGSGYQAAGATSRSSGGRGTLQGSGTGRVSSKIKGGGSRDGIAKKSRSGGTVRSDENIQLTFEKIKGSLYSIYRRELRKDPTLQGKVVFQLEIAPSGKVVKVSIKSSDLNNPKLEKKLLAKIRRLNFGASNVATWKGVYGVDFLPG